MLISKFIRRYCLRTLSSRALLTSALIRQADLRYFSTIAGSLRGGFGVNRGGCRFAAVEVVFTKVDVGRKEVV